MSAQIDYINYVVIGTGINVNQMEFPEEIAEIATSLAIETGHPVNRAKVVAAVLEAFEEDYEKFLEAGDLSGLKEAYEAVLANKNQPVRVLDPKEPFEGVALGITPTGELRVQKRTERSLRCIPARFRCEAYTATYRGNGKEEKGKIMYSDNEK